MKKRITAFLIALISLAASGCSSVLEGEISSSTPVHISVDSEETDGTENPSNYTEVSQYEVFKASIRAMISRHTDTQTFRISSFDRDDVPGAVQQACQEIESDDPLGSYAVYYINSSVTQSASFYNVEVSIVYRATKDEVDSLCSVSSNRYLEYLLLDNISQGKTEFAFYTQHDGITGQVISDTITRLYYENPLEVILPPTALTVCYPKEEGYRIMEVGLVYSYTPGVLDNMRVTLNSKILEMAEPLGATNDGVLYLLMCQSLMTECELTDTAAVQIDDTAYGAIVNGECTAEGMAMAYKAMCDKMGLECTVVRGLLNGQAHFWNVINLEGSYYHVDISACISGGMEAGFLLSDDDMPEGYWWDSVITPACSGTRTYEDYASYSQLA